MVAARVTPDELSEVIQWLDSPLAQKIRKHETQVATVEGMAAMQKFGYNVAGRCHPGQSCKSCARRLKMNSSWHRTSQTSLCPFSQDWKGRWRKKSGATPAQVAEIASQLPIPDKEPMRKDTIALCLFTYRNLSDEEIQQ